MKIVVTGKNGQVARSLMERANEFAVDVRCVGRPELDLADPGAVVDVLVGEAPDVIVSAAAFTAVDAAETDAAAAFAVNAVGAGGVAKAAALLSVPVLHLSTDYVFSGSKLDPYREDDQPDPVSVYGQSKLEGEKAVAAAGDNHVILRTAWVYSPFGSNFVKTMLRLGETRDTVRVVADQRGCPTSALDIAAALLTMAIRLKRDPSPELRGVFNLSGRGEATWADLAEHIFTRSEAKTGRAVRVERIATSEYPTAARRPSNSRLETSKIARIHGIEMPEWRPSVDAVLSRLLPDG